MNAASVAPGCIFHWSDYQFSDGERANKYFVIVGAKQGQNYLAVIATSKKRQRDFKPGCNHEQGYYHIPGGKKDWFPEDTWLLIAEPVELSAGDFLKQALNKEIELKGQLRGDIANAIKNCMRKCGDVSDYHRSLL
jgi:hypothetical protein